MKNKTTPKVETRKDEIRLSTTDQKEMRGKYLAADLRRGWTEDFIDEDTGETVSIQRHEIIARIGQLIDDDRLSRINFHMLAGDITIVEVSNQRREATMLTDLYPSPWSVTAMIGRKKRRFLLYAASLQMAVEIAQDYIELNFTEHFHFICAKTFDYCVFIKDTLKKVESDTDPVEQDFYKIEVDAVFEHYNTSYTFVLQTKDVNTGVIIINNWIAQTMKDRPKEHHDKEDLEFKTTVISGVVIPCFRIIEKEFSQAYFNDANNKLG